MGGDGTLRGPLRVAHDTGERRGRVKLRNMYKGPMDKDNGGGGKIECGRWVVGRSGEGNRRKMGTTVIEQQ